jgi:hypothetical protein
MVEPSCGIMSPFLFIFLLRRKEFSCIGSKRSWWGLETMNTIR